MLHLGQGLQVAAGAAAVVTCWLLALFYLISLEDVLLDPQGGVAADFLGQETLESSWLLHHVIVVGDAIVLTRLHTPPLSILRSD